MERKIIYTADGSHSVSIPEMNVTYHSIHGAIQESNHVFIRAGFYASDRLKRSDALRIFEVGFGTGLNALLTLIEAEKLNRKIYYETIELFPLAIEQVKLLNYCRQLQRTDLQSLFEEMHNREWEKKISLTENFSV